MANRPIRVLVVDDSALAREIISDAVRAEPDMELAGAACDGRKALELLDAAQPDVITLDVQMPLMDGLAALSAILARRPTPVIMVSALTQLGATTTLEALDLGALDYVAKPETGGTGRAMAQDELLRKIRAVAGVNVPRLLEIRRRRNERLKLLRALGGVTAPSAPVDTPADLTAPELADKCIAIGISTGGPPALTALFGSLEPPLPPIVVVQHMPPQFTKAFAWRLDSTSKLSIKEAAAGDVLQPNCAYVAPGGSHLHLRRRGRGATIDIADGEVVSGHKPSADVMMSCAAEIYGSRCLGIIMTGMGRDGADGCARIREAGGYVLGQDEASSDVYGMNKVAMVEGGVDRQFSLDEGAHVIVQHVRRAWGRATVGA